MLNASLGYYLGVGQYRDNSWAQPDSLGGAKTFSSKTICYGRTVLAIATPKIRYVYGSRRCPIVVRYNTMHATGTSATFGIFQNHGMDSVAEHAAAEKPEYTIIPITARLRERDALDSMAACEAARDFFSAISFFSPERSAGSSIKLNLSIYRNAGSWNAPFGFCGGGNDSGADGAYDQNDGVVYYSGTATAGGTLTLTDTSKSLRIGSVRLAVFGLRRHAGMVLRGRIEHQHYDHGAGCNRYQPRAFHGIQQRR